jgi:protein dispatched 1
MIQDDDETPMPSSTTMAAETELPATQETSSSSSEDEAVGPPRRMSFAERTSRRVARNPHTHLWIALITAMTISVLGMYFGQFTISLEKIGWPCRGTLIANRQTQWMLIFRNREKLSKKNNSHVWRNLTTTVQLGWEVNRADTANATGKGNKTLTNPGNNNTLEAQGHNETLDEQGINKTLEEQGNMTSLHHTPTDIMTLLDQCDVDMYNRAEFFERSKLWPVWKVTGSNSSALDPLVLQELCMAEEQTQAILHANGLCFGCGNGQCLPPFSLVFYVRFSLPNGFGMTCQELAQAYAPIQHATEQEMTKCVQYLRGVTDFLYDAEIDRGPCPSIFSPHLVDNLFDKTGRVTYTSSIFVTYRNRTDIKLMYKYAQEFDHGGSHLKGAYDTQISHFIEFYGTTRALKDIPLAAGSAMITAMAMLIHTRSPFLTLMGILEICLSFPLAYTVYRLIGGITFFPVLNPVGLFISFALGADHIFVAVDRWKNQRNDHPDATTEEIASKALPGAGQAMVLTTITTAIAFLTTALCPVVPIKLFGIFVGLLIAIDFIFDVLVMFPSLCIYDGYRFKENCFMEIRCFRSQSQPPRNKSDCPLEDSEEEAKVGDEDNMNFKHDAASQGKDATPPYIPPENRALIRRILTSYYNFLHRWRWSLMALTLAALGVCIYFATKLEPPQASFDIKFLVDSVEYEEARTFRNELLFTTLLSQSGGTANIIFGVTPADTGNHMDPYTWSELVLDDSFDPSSEPAQIYMRDFCSNLWAQEFADPTGNCSINVFDKWLQIQADLLEDERNASYTQHCAGATAMPLIQDVFHPCLSAWAQQENNTKILAWDGKVRVVWIEFKSRVRQQSARKLLGSEWRLIEGWMLETAKGAPTGVANAYFTSFEWWLWDTFNAVYQSAIGSAAITIVISGIVIFISSKSLSMTIFSAISVTYVLVSVASMMVAIGMTLGFL